MTKLCKLDRKRDYIRFRSPCVLNTSAQLNKYVKEEWMVDGESVAKNMWKWLIPICLLGTKTKKQTTLPFKPIKKGKKRNPWSDSESDMSSNESDFDVPPREIEPRRAAGKHKQTAC